MGLIMSEDNFPAKIGPGHSGKANSWRWHLPYLLVLAMALAGVAYANMSQKPLAGYWELLALISGGVCIFTEWSKTGPITLVAKLGTNPPNCDSARLRLPWRRQRFDPSQPNIHCGPPDREQR
jgi:hypothetical protein